MSNWLVENSVLTLWDVCTVSVSYLDWVINGLCLLTRDSLFSYHLSMLVWSFDFYSWIVGKELLASNSLVTWEHIWFRIVQSIPTDLIWWLVHTILRKFKILCNILRFTFLCVEWILYFLYYSYNVFYVDCLWHIHY